MSRATNKKLLGRATLPEKFLVWVTARRKGLNISLFSRTRESSCHVDYPCSGCAMQFASVRKRPTKLLSLYMLPTGSIVCTEYLIARFVFGRAATVFGNSRAVAVRSEGQSSGNPDCRAVQGALDMIIWSNPWLVVFRWKHETLGLLLLDGHARAGEPSNAHPPRRPHQDVLAKSQLQSSPGVERPADSSEGKASRRTVTD
ncbi:hypothetical protein EV426DRAFT_574973 [Tirmania nivea]|nr:hypothetical protein EV426DRAFT_574973 [Tirmania nivea]